MKRRIRLGIVVVATLSAAGCAAAPGVSSTSADSSRGEAPASVEEEPVAVEEVSDDEARSEPEEDLASQWAGEKRIIAVDLGASPSGDLADADTTPADLLEAGGFNDFLDIPGATPYAWSVELVEGPFGEGLSHTRRDMYQYEFFSDLDESAAADEISAAIESSPGIDELQDVQRRTDRSDGVRSVEMVWFFDPAVDRIDLTFWKVTVATQDDRPGRLRVGIETARDEESPVPWPDDSFIPEAAAFLSDIRADGAERGWVEVGWEYSDSIRRVVGTPVVEGEVDYDLGAGGESELAAAAADVAASLDPIDSVLDDSDDYYAYTSGDVSYTLTTKFGYGSMMATIERRVL